MVRLDSLATAAGEPLQAYRLVNSKFPPIHLFDDVADSEDFDALFLLLGDEDRAGGLERLV